MIYFGILCDRMSLMFTITRKNCHQKQNLAFSEVSGGPKYCNINGNSGTKTYTANLIFMGNL